MVPIGHEMIVCNRKKLLMPSIVSIQHDEMKDPKLIKRIIFQMTKFIPSERKKIHQVEIEMKGNRYLYFSIDI